MRVKPAVNVMKDLARPYAITSRKHGLAVIRVAVDALDSLGANKEWIQAIINTVLGTAVRSEVKK
jgi:hypothetical protein